MDDRELLALAARAAGIENLALPGASVIVRSDGDGYSCTWRPLDDHRDALELLADLRVSLNYSGRYVRARIYQQGQPAVSVREKIDGRVYGHRHIATRRAIVRAAAAMGKALPLNASLSGPARSDGSA